MSKYYVVYYGGQWDRIEWFNEFGHIHNYDDLPAVIYTGGGESYYKNSQLHRDDGPAIIHIWQDNTFSLWWYHDDVRYTPKCVKL